MLPTLNDLIHFAKGAGEILMGGYGKKHQVQHKGRTDLVTEIDRDSENYLVNQIRTHFANHTIIAEESGHLAGQNDHCWFVDPLDGTSNYAHGVPIFSVTLAYAFKGKVQLGVVYDPTRDQCFSAERGKGAWLNGNAIHVSQTSQLIDSMLVTGFPYDLKDNQNNNIDNFTRFFYRAQSIRRLGSAAIDVAYVAAGWYDGYWEVSIYPWDIAAGTLMVEEAGGVVTDLNGDPDYLKPPYAIIATNYNLHPKMLAILQGTGRTK